MTVAELGVRMSAAELTEWKAYYAVQHQEQAKEREQAMGR